MPPHLDRLNAVRGLFEDDLDTLLISDPSDVRWASGFRGSVAQLIVRKDGATLIVDPRYGDQAAEQATDCEVLVGASVAARDDLLRTALLESRRTGFDERCTTVGEWRRLCGLIGGELVGKDKPLARLRSVKDSSETAAIEQAAAIADQAYLAVRAMLGTSSMTEQDVRDELEARMRGFGANSAAYPTIVASGPNSALPHHLPTNRRIREGDSVVIDVGAEVDGYRSDMTRTLLIGDVDPSLRRMFDAVLLAQRTVVSAVRPGVVAGSLDHLARDTMSEFGVFIMHATGHGVGLDIHEAPWLRNGSSEVLQEGHVVTVEPGLYRVGVGGVRIEDLLLVESTGSRTFTTSPKDPLCLQSAPTT